MQLCLPVNPQYFAKQAVFWDFVRNSGNKLPLPFFITPVYIIYTISRLIGQSPDKGLIKI